MRTGARPADDVVGPLLWIIVVVAVVLGTGLRCTNVPDKLFWHDEAHGAFRVSGFSGREVDGQLFGGEVLTRQDVLPYQHPARGTGLPETLVALTDEPQHPPAYYLLTRAGFLFSDDPRIAMRAVSVAAGLLLLPALYWLWTELFGNRRGALILVSVAALSPLQILYSQEARQYSLWTTLAFAATAALMRARRTGTSAAWLLYGLLVAAGIYTHLLFIGTVAAHAAWMLWEYRRAGRASFLRFVVAAGLAGMAFLPWASLLLREHESVLATTDWMRTSLALADLASEWKTQCARQFVDVPGLNWVGGLVVIVVIVATVFIWRKGAAPGRLVVLSLLGTWGVVLGPDLLFGGRASTQTRFLLPALMWTAVCTVYLLDRAALRRDGVARAAGLVAWVAALGIGLVSGCAITSSGTWWNKVVSGIDDLEVAQRLNGAERPMLVIQGYDINLGQLLSLAHSVDDKVRFLPIDSRQTLPLEKLCGDVLVLNPTATLVAEMKVEGSATEIEPRNRLWLFKPQPRTTAGAGQAACTVAVRAGTDA